MPWVQHYTLNELGAHTSELRSPFIDSCQMQLEHCHRHAKFHVPNKAI
jgi:hypothetical protein